VVPCNGLAIEIGPMLMTVLLALVGALTASGALVTSRLRARDSNGLQKS
jgi:hypothetical protein